NQENIQTRRHQSLQAAVQLSLQRISSSYLAGTTSTSQVAVAILPVPLSTDGSISPSLTLSVLLSEVNSLINYHERLLIHSLLTLNISFITISMHCAHISLETGNILSCCRILADDLVTVPTFTDFCRPLMPILNYRILISIAIPPE